MVPARRMAGRACRPRATRRSRSCRACAGAVVDVDARAPPRRGSAAPCAESVDAVSLARSTGTPVLVSSTGPRSFGSRPSSLRRIAMRSASGGCVSNRRLVLCVLVRCPPSASGVDEPEVRGRARHVVQHGVVGFELLERPAQAVGRHERDRARVGELLAVARDRRATACRAPNARMPARTAIAMSTNAPPSLLLSSPQSAKNDRAGRDLGDRDEHADGRDRERRDLHVAVADVRHLVGEHALELAARHQVEQAAGDRDAGVARGAAEREGVGRGIVDDVDLRLRQPGRGCTGLRSRCAAPAPVPGVTSTAWVSEIVARTATSPADERRPRSRPPRRPRRRRRASR